MSSPPAGDQNSVVADTTVRPTRTTARCTSSAAKTTRRDEARRCCRRPRVRCARSGGGGVRSGLESVQDDALTLGLERTRRVLRQHARCVSRAGVRWWAPWRPVSADRRRRLRRKTRPVNRQSSLSSTFRCRGAGRETRLGRTTVGGCRPSVHREPGSTSTRPRGPTVPRRHPGPRRPGTPWSRRTLRDVPGPAADTGPMRVLDIGGGRRAGRPAAGRPTVNDVTASGRRPSRCCSAAVRERGERRPRTAGAVRALGGDARTWRPWPRSTTTVPVPASCWRSPPSDTTRRPRPALLGGCRGSGGHGVRDRPEPGAGRLIRPRCCAWDPSEALAERRPRHDPDGDLRPRRAQDRCSTEVEAELVSLGCTVTGRYGGRIANDLIVDNTP